MGSVHQSCDASSKQHMGHSDMMENSNGMSCKCSKNSLSSFAFLFRADVDKVSWLKVSPSPEVVIPQRCHTP